MSLSHGQLALCQVHFMIRKLLIPCVNVVMLAIMWFKPVKAFGHGVGYGFGLWLLNTIFILILGFGSSTYQGVPGKN